MEEARDSRRKSDSSRKRTRKRSHTKKASPMSGSYINTAEARREIVSALELHRQSSKPAILCGSSSQKYYCRQLTESLPIPEPTWSTTAPAVLCAPFPTVDVLEVEWFDNVASSSSWWLGFLKSLDSSSKKDGVNELTESSNAFGACMDVARCDSDSNRFTDAWVIYPAVEDEEEESKCNAFN